MNKIFQRKYSKSCGNPALDDPESSIIWKLTKRCIILFKLIKKDYLQGKFI
jgi:hypothetical protein